MKPTGTGDAANWDGIWQHCAASSATPGFDIGRPHQVLVDLVADGRVPEGRALVPGCGRGYDVALLASPTRYAVGLDLSPAGVREAEAYLASAVPDKAGSFEVVAGDFFAYAPSAPFDFVFDYTFLCALLPERRAAWAATMARLIRPGGKLCTLQFPLGPYGETHPVDAPLDYTRGPPFLLTKQLYHDLLEPVGFVCEHEADVPREKSFPKRAGVEAVAVWVRAA